MTDLLEFGSVTARSAEPNAITVFNIIDLLAKNLQQKDAPEAYMMYALYDSDSVMYKTGKQVLTINAANRHEVLEEDLYISEYGYMEAFLVNETQEDVWFDDFSIQSTSSFIVQETHYDPWGLELTGLGFQAGGGVKVNRYLYNGKEIQNAHNLGLYDYGARFYDPVIGRWNVVDPLAEERQWVSPYNYVQNNPMLRIDPDGKLDDYFNREGKYLGSDGAKTDYVRIIDQQDWDTNNTVEKGKVSIDHSIGVGISKLMSESDISTEAALSVYSHYNDTDLPTSIDNNLKGVAAFRYLTSQDKKVIRGSEELVFNHRNLTKNRISDHYNEIKNVIIHESSHYNEFRTLGPDTYNKMVNLNRSGTERRAVNLQVNHPTFSQTRSVYQIATIQYGINNGFIPLMKSIKRY